MEFVLVGTILAIAACVQGAIGFGLGMLAAPLIALIAPELLPRASAGIGLCAFFCDVLQGAGRNQMVGSWLGELG